MVIDYLHEKDEDMDIDINMPKEEGQFRELLRLTVGELKTIRLHCLFYFRL
jgi:hypothetical protein